MYGYPEFVSINLVRTRMLKKMVGINKRLTSKSLVDLSRLPPSRECLIPHIQRVNHQLAPFVQANLLIHWFPKPYDLEQGWQKTTIFFKRGGVAEEFCRLLLSSLWMIFSTRTKEESFKILKRKILMMIKFIDFNIVLLLKRYLRFFNLKVFSDILWISVTQLSPFAGFVKVSYL